MIILYDTEELEFETLGLGVLRDAISVSVTEELNGLFELTIEYPIDGYLFNELKSLLCLFRPGRDRLLYRQPGIFPGA